MKIHTIGGYDEVGKNMTVLDLGEDAFIFDSGLFMPAVVEMQEREKTLTENSLRSLGALPNDIYLEEKNLRNKIRAILVSHAHLDHVGALPYNSYRYKAPVLGTPFTTEVLKVLMQDNNQSIPNKIISIQPNSSFIIKGKSSSYKIEFINMTHSTIQSSAIAVHTPEGVVLYANDFKLDNTPILGDKPNYLRLKQLSKQGIKAIIIDSLYAGDDRKTPSEKIARGLLEDVLFTTDNRNNGIIITTFSSHIARLKTISEFGRRLGREVIFAGRSLNKYMTAATNINKAPFRKDVRIISFKKQLEKTFKQINRRKRDYLLVCTGHQGEPGSILDRIARNQLALNLSKDDQLIFSSKTIPTPINEENKEQLNKRLKKHHVRIFENVHVSGHGGKEDIRDLIKLTAPEHIIPSHGDLKKRTAGAKLAEELGYRIGKTAHITQNLKSLTLK